MGKQSEQVMKKYLLPVLFIFLLIFPADSSAGSKTRAQVLSYLNSLPSQSNKKVLSGQRIGYLNSGRNGHDMYGNDIFGDIATNSGGYVPAIMGADIDYNAYWSAPYDFSLLINHWNAGGLVEVDWFASNPGNGNVYTWPPNTPTIDIADVYTSGNSTYNNFRTQMEHVAVGLQQLQNNGVIVLFRPFFEMNDHNYTPNFWWAGKDATKYVTMWRYVHDYFTNTKGLTNLIWVYGVTRYYDVLEYYPGSAYVDIVGIDYYTDNQRFPWLSDYETLLSLGKPFAMTELGQCDGSTSWDTCTGKDTRHIISDIKASFPNTVYWYSWDDNWELGQQSNLSSLFADSWVVNRSDNPSGATGVPALAISSGTVLPSGQQNVSYALALSATGGTSPYTWSLLSGNLPEGISLSSSGVISGTPTAGAVGTRSFTIQVAASGNTATKAFSVEMVPAVSGQSKKVSYPAGISIQ